MDIADKLAKAKAKMRQYDMCAYRGCRKGRFTTNTRLYRFPKEKDPRFAIWIENSGNERLKYLAVSTLRGNGLCQDHFDPKYIAGNSNLLRDAIPKKYIPPQKSVPATKLPDGFLARAANLLKEPENVPKIIITCKSPETLNIPALLSACTSAVANKYKNIGTPFAKDAKVEIDLTRIVETSDEPIDESNAEVANTGESEAGRLTDRPSGKSITTRTIDRTTWKLRKRIAHLNKENAKLKRTNLLREKTIRILRRKLMRTSSATKKKSDDDFLDRRARKISKLAFLRET